MRTIVRRWGNSLGLRIPREIAWQAGIHEGSIVELTLEQDYVRITVVAG